MPFTRPSNVSADAQAWYDSDNEEVRSNIPIQSDMPKFRAIIDSTGHSSITNDTTKIVEWDTFPIDTHSAWDWSSSTATTYGPYWYCPQSGYYMVNCTVLFDTGVDGNLKSATVHLTEATFGGGTQNSIASSLIASPTSAGTSYTSESVSLNTMLFLTKNRYYRIEAGGETTAGGNVLINRYQSLSANIGGEARLVTREGTTTYWSMYKVV